MFSPSNLVRIRKSQGLTQEAVARRSGLATVTISKLEAGKNSNPKASTLVKLADALQSPLDVFFEQTATDEGMGDGHD